jgi:dTDP-4-amino-4,6-dideoxygalactose transaminase
LACDMDEILAISRRHNLRVIEDAAHALPSTFRGRLVGSFESDATVFSFYATKTLATGEGGMVVTKDKTIAERCRVMRLHGINRDAFDRYTSKKPSWQYDVVAPGFKYNMTDITAALGIQQLKKVWRFQQRRLKLAETYNRELNNLPILLPPDARGKDLHSWHLYVIRLDKSTSLSRDEFISRMYEKGIGCSVHYIPLHLHSYWKTTYSLSSDAFPQTNAVSERAVSLPIYTRMSDDDQSRVIDAVRTILH